MIEQRTISETAQQYDVFMSVADPDYQAAQAIAFALREHGITVVVDNEIDASEAPSTLDQSKLLVPYYSHHFVEEPRCQEALLGAFLAGHRNADPLKYIATINPDDPVSSHIVPVEISDAKYAVPKLNLSPIAEAIEKKLAKTSNTIGQAPVAAPSAFIGKSVNETHLAGRYAELWRLHSALVIDQFLMTQSMSPGRMVAISGAPDIGKTSLAAVYAELFGAQYQGGVYWTSLQECQPTSEAICERYGEELNRIGALIELPEEAPKKSRLIRRMVHYLQNLSAPALWIIDDIPDGTDPCIANELVIPEGRLHTIFISRSKVFRDAMDNVEF